MLRPPRLAAFAWIAATLALTACGETVRQTPPPRLAPTPEAQAAAIAPLPGQVAPPAPDLPAKPLPVKVGLLLPLSGPDANLGRAMLEAAQMALFDIGEETLTLVPRDTTPGAAAAAGAVLGEGAQLVLGPLFSADVQAAAPIARARNVNIIAFSTDRGVAGNGVYLISSTPEEQVQRVMSHAASQGLKRFAVLAPDNAYGTTVIGAAKQAAAQANAIDPTVATYAPGQSTPDALGQAVKRLVRGTEPTFDALLIPEGGARLKTIAGQLGPGNIDPSKIRLLGTTLWGGEQELGREPALVGGWFAGPPPDTLAAFADRFSRLYGRAPPRLAGIAYDAVALAAVLAKAPEPVRFKTEQILNPSGFAGYEGVFRFRRDGVGERGLAIMQVEPQGIRTVADAPQSFQAVGQ